MRFRATVSSLSTNGIIANTALITDTSWGATYLVTATVQSEYQFFIPWAAKRQS